MAALRLTASTSHTASIPASSAFCKAPARPGNLRTHCRGRNMKPVQHPALVRLFFHRADTSSTNFLARRRDQSIQWSPQSLPRPLDAGDLAPPPITPTTLRPYSGEYIFDFGRPDSWTPLCCPCGGRWYAISYLGQQLLHASGGATTSCTQPPPASQRAHHAHPGTTWTATSPDSIRLEHHHRSRCVVHPRPRSRLSTAQHGEPRAHYSYHLSQITASHHHNPTPLAAPPPLLHASARTCSPPTGRAPATARSMSLWKAESGFAACSAGRRGAGDAVIE